MERTLADLAADSSISSRCLAFCWAMADMAAGRERFRADRRSVEAVTGMLHHRWPEDEAKALGVVLVDRGSWDVVDDHGMAGLWQVRQFGPTACSHTDLPCTSTVLYEADTQHSRCGTELTQVLDPGHYVFERLGRYSYDGWRLHLLVGLVDVEVSVKDLPWFKSSQVRAAQRFLAKAREVGLVVDGVWQGQKVAQMADALGEAGMLSRTRRLEKAEAERRAWRERRARIRVQVEAFSRVLDGMVDLAREVGAAEALDLLVTLDSPEAIRSWLEPVTEVAGW